MCKKQTSVSHSSTESEVMSSDAGLRMDSLPALDLWDVVIEVLRSTQDNVNSAHGRLERDQRSHSNLSKRRPKTLICRM